MGKVKKDDRSPLSARSKGVLQKPNTSAAPTLINKHKLQKSKKEKLKEKHETFIQKLSSNKTAQESRKEGQGLSFIDMIESLKSEEKQMEIRDKKRKEMREKIRKSSKPMKMTKRNEELASGRQAFGLVLGHAQFQQNPLATIREHLKNSLAAQNQQ